jgi:serine/threonine-protein kinase
MPTLPGDVPVADTASVSGSLVGTQVGDFDLLEEVGRGGMGIVYKARQRTLGRMVALKMLPAGGLQSRTTLARFLSEARAAASLTHPNIVTIYQVGECPAGHFFAMEFVEGQTLESILRKGPVPIPWAAALVAAIADAVDYAHGKGIIHRDLKPGNIMIDRLRRPVVMDFGIAKVLGKSTSLTQQGDIVGTPSYMAPEQARSATVPIGPYTDVYSLGAILYTMLASRPPFEEATTLDTLLKVISDERPPPVRQFRPEVPDGLERICMKCLDKTHTARYPTARALADVLRRFRSSGAGGKLEPASSRRTLPSIVLVARETGKEIRLYSGTVTIGRSSECDIKLKASDVSKRHCQLRIDPSQVLVEDLGSANGIAVNGQPVRRSPLKDGDVLEIAGHAFEVRLAKKA